MQQFYFRGDGYDPLTTPHVEDMQLRNLPLNTQRAYLSAVAKFAQHFGQSPDTLGLEQVRTYQLHLLHQKKSLSALTIAVSALRFLYRVTLGKDWALCDFQRRLSLSCESFCRPSALLRQ